MSWQTKGPIQGRCKAIWNNARFEVRYTRAPGRVKNFLEVTLQMRTIPLWTMIGSLAASCAANGETGTEKRAVGIRTGVHNSQERLCPRGSSWLRIGSASLVLWGLILEGAGHGEGRGKTDVT